MRGELVFLSLYDVGAELDLDRLKSVRGLAPEAAPLVSGAAAPDYAAIPSPREVRFTVASATGKGVAGPVDVEVRIHAVGVAAIRIRVPFDVTDTAAMGRFRRDVRIAGKPLKEAAAGTFADVKADVAAAAIEPYPGLVEPERYVAFCVHAPPDEVMRDRDAVAALITGEDNHLVPAVVESALKHTVRYYQDDAVVIGWDHALVVAPEGRYEDVLDVMELANLELLEFRTYDDYLDRRLDESFATLDRLWAPGGLFRSARKVLQEFSEMRVDFARLTDHLHDTGKLFGEWYVAKLHQHLRDAFHLDSWERAVASKMETLEDMFHLAEEEANHRRNLILEAMIVMLFILDLILIFLIK